MSKAVEQTARALGFEEWQTGGGCTAYVREWANGQTVWATDIGGTSNPTESDWMIGVYPDAEDMTAFSAMLRFDDEASPRTFAQALQQALNAAEALLPSTETLTDEYDAWIDSTLPSATRAAIPNDAHISADELIAELQALNAADFKSEIEWLQAFIARWDEAQAHEDFQRACASRGES